MSKSKLDQPSAADKNTAAKDNVSAPRTLSTGARQGIAGGVWLSVGMHLLIGGIIFVSMEFTPDFEKPSLNVDLSNIEDQIEEDEIVSAVTVDKQAVEQQANAIRERQREAAQAEQQRLAEIERRAEEARRKTETERQQQRELAAQREREKREAEQEVQRLKEQREAEEKAAQEAAERRAQEEAEAKRRQEERERREAEEAARREEERRKAEREAQMQKELQEEMAERQRARRQQMQSEIEKYTALIAQTIQRNWNVDDSMRGKSCELTIDVSPSGFVKSVTTGSGDDNVCRSARNAVLKANTLPVSEDPDIYQEMATIKLTVRPEL